MQRGILEITIDEFIAITKVFDVRKFVGTTLATKVAAAITSLEDAVPNVPIRLEFSEEELETLLDAIGLESGDETFMSAKQKVNAMLAGFRS